MLAPARLSTGRGTLAADRALLELAAARSEFGPFDDMRSATADLVVRSAGLPRKGSLDLCGLERSFGRYRVSHEELLVDLQGGPEPAIAALRMGWHLLVARAGGVMIHGCAVGFSGRAVIATGVSGAGKSTLASFLIQAGGTLLSDEIIALYPDGSVYGTPFRSDLEVPGTPEQFQIGAMLLLRKGGEERIDPVSSRELIHAVMGQAFTPEGGELSRADALARLTSALKDARTGTLTFRKNPAAGEFVREWLLAPRR